MPPDRRSMTGALLREARRDDIAAIQRVRASVRENRLRSRRISDAEVQRYLELLGRGWVMEVDGEVVAFAIGDATIGNIWALFVDPRYERRGYGRRLHDTMVAWLWTRGLQHLWLATEAGTRAEGFYRAAGWREAGRTPHGELSFVRDRPASDDATAGSDMSPPTVRIPAAGADSACAPAFDPTSGPGAAERT
jgi:GNAT superfamily N-acetyltransferase